MSGRIIKVNINDLMYSICVFWYVFLTSTQCSWLTSKFVVSAKPLVAILAVMLLCFLIRRTPYELKILFVVLFLCGLVVYLNSKSLLVLQTVVFAFAAYGRDYYKILKVVLLSSFVSMILIIIVGATGMVPNYSYYRESSFYIIKKRYNFGFLHPNTFSAYYMGVLFLVYMNLKNRYRLFYILLLLFSIFLIYTYPNSNTVCIILIVFFIYVFVNYIYNFKPRKRASFWGKSIQWMIYIAIPILCVMLVVISYKNMYSGLFRALGENVLVRLKMSNIALHKYGISLFGQKIEIYGTTYFLTHSFTMHQWFAIDMLYVLIIIRDGILAFVIFWGIIMKTVRNVACANYWPLLIIIALMLVFSIMETGLAMPEMLFIPSAAFAKLPNYSMGN